jgi:hypothetical protein
MIASIVFPFFPDEQLNQDKLPYLFLYVCDFGARKNPHLVAIFLFIIFLVIVIFFFYVVIYHHITKEMNSFVSHLLVLISNSIIPVLIFPAIHAIGYSIHFSSSIAIPIFMYLFIVLLCCYIRFFHVYHLFQSFLKITFLLFWIFVNFLLLLFVLH